MPEAGSVITEYFTAQHRHLESLLQRAFGSPDTIDAKAYAGFRAGLLKHIATEERILIPVLVEHLKGGRYPLAARLRLEHGAIAALLVLPPSELVKNALLYILKRHNQIEECAPGLYYDCDSLPPDIVEMVMQKAKVYPDVPVMPHNGSKHAIDAAKRAVARAGYDIEKITDNYI